MKKFIEKIVFNIVILWEFSKYVVFNKWLDVLIDDEFKKVGMEKGDLRW